MNLYSAEDIVSASFIFKNGIIGSGLWCFTSNIKEDLVEIIGQRGKIVFSTFTPDPIRIQTKKNQETINIDHPSHIQQPHIQSIIDELLGVGKCPSHGETAARTSWVMDQITKEWRALNGVKFD